MEDKLVPQTVYLPDQIVLSKDEFRSIVAEAQGDAYACGLEGISVRKSKKLSDTYIDNLLQL